MRGIDADMRLHPEMPLVLCTDILVFSIQ